MLSYVEFCGELAKMRFPGSTVQTFVSRLKSFDPGTVVGLLEEVIRRENDVLRCEALDVMSHLSHVATILNSLLMLRSDDPQVRRSVCEILGRFVHEDNETLLLNHLPRESHPEVRCAIVASLENVGSKRSTPVLVEIQANDTSHDLEERPISDFATDAIAAIDTRQGK